jgi:hypothetical protein
MILHSYWLLASGRSQSDVTTFGAALEEIFALGCRNFAIVDLFIEAELLSFLQTCRWRNALASSE